MSIADDAMLPRSYKTQRTIVICKGELTAEQWESKRLIARTLRSVVIWIISDRAITIVL